MMDLRVVTYDSYQAYPSALDKKWVSLNGIPIADTSLTVITVPIVRVYAYNNTNHTVLLHVHNIFPYLYVPFPKAMAWASELTKEQVNELTKWLHEINTKVAQSYRSNNKKKKKSQRRSKTKHPTEHDSGSAGLGPDSAPPSASDSDSDSDSGSDDNSGESQYHSYVSDISIVSGTPFYGYHLNQSTFLKISLSSPKYVVRLSKLLTDCKIFNKFIQPHHSHVPYILQFLTDYNIFTLKEITLSKYLWRYPLILLNEVSDTYQPFFNTHFVEFNKLKFDTQLKKFINSHIHKLNNGNSLNILNPEKFLRIGRSMIELDVTSAWIDNRYSLHERKVSKLYESFSHLTQYITSTKPLLDDVDNLRKSRNLHTDISRLGLFDDIQRTTNNGSNWIEQDELNRLLSKSISLSYDSFTRKFKTNKIHETFDKFSLKDPKFLSAFQSIENLQYSPDLSNCLMDIILFNLNSNDFFNSLKNLNTVFYPDLYQQLSKDNDTLDGNNESGYENDSDNDNDSASDADNANGENTDEKQNPVEISKSSLIVNDTRNLTVRLQEASINIDEDDSNILNNSNVLDSFKFSNKQQSIISLSQRNNSVNNSSFNSFFQDLENHERLYIFNIQQPLFENADDFLNDLEKNYNLPKIEYPVPFYSKLSNYDTKPFIFAGEKFQLKCKEVDMDLYPGINQSMNFQKGSDSAHFIWKYTPKLPSYDKILKWLKEEKVSTQITSHIFDSQIKGPTQQFKGYKYPSLQTPIERISNNENILSILIIEIHVNTKGILMPDPKNDEISAIFWNTNNPGNYGLEKIGVMINCNLNINLSENYTVFKCNNELDLIISLVSLVELIDPDIFCGFELHAGSWGYIIERIKFKYDIDLLHRLSRVVYKQNNKLSDRWGYTHASGIKITGRQMLNLWRRLRSELTLTHYSLENIVYHIFHIRIPKFNHSQLTDLWKNLNERGLSYILNYYISRVKYEMELIEKLELIERINEQSRLLGIDFYSIIYRGSQFKVECLLVRLTNAESFILVSPSKKQVFKQDSLECIPLVMEPNSSFYKSPLVVLDFQSLYPSLIIAYNICYSTMLGRLKNYDPNKFTKMGVTNYKSTEGILKKFENDINLTPNGMMFVRDNVRKSLLGKMLIEILNARIYIKGTMSEFKDDQELQKLYNNRQLALKLIANVTYGYTSATYSGRMPNSDIADAIVSCGRETLLKAIKEIESHDEWGAKVVYGDTDSLFIYLPGKTKDDAFRIGKEMADHITKLNPKPVKLKLEKVYLPSILISKKRYIGWSFEHESQTSPKFDAKGIETVRRDGIPAQQKILEKAITLLFETRDISKVKAYIIEQFIKIVRNKVNIKDFMFAKEVRVGTYKNEKYIPPGARLAIKRTLNDRRLEPQYKERVFYLVRKGHNKEILRDRCISPNDFLNDSGILLDSDYYINKVLVPPLERIFNLLGVDIRLWIKDIPQTISYQGIGVTLKNVKIQSCLNCGSASNEGMLCAFCKENELETILNLKTNLKNLELKSYDYIDFCKACTRNILHESVDSGIAEKCCNEDCSIYYSRVKNINETKSLLEKYQKIPDW